MRKGIVIAIVAAIVGAGIWAISKCGGVCPMPSSQAQAK